MVDNELFDVFIAYHGNKETGSEQAAEEVYKEINGVEIYKGKRIKAYFHPRTNPHGKFEDTPRIVARTPMFLFVVDKRVKRNQFGQLAESREDKKKSNIYEEISSFHDSPMYDAHGREKAVTLFISDDMDFDSAKRLDPMFAGKVFLKTCEDVLRWIFDFYMKTYVERIHENCKYLATHKQDEFMLGAWVKDAENIWTGLRSERMCRLLLMYYIVKTTEGDSVARERLKAMIREVSEIVNPEPGTLILLEQARMRI